MQIDTYGDQITTRKTHSCSQFSEPWSIDDTDGFQKFPRHTKLKNDWKTYCNLGKFDVERVEFTTKWGLPNCEGYCTTKQHRSSIYTSDIN